MLVLVMVMMEKVGVLCFVEGKFECCDSICEIEVEDMVVFEVKVFDGWCMLFVCWS